MRLATIALVLLCSAVASAQDCTPTYVYGKIGWSNDATMNLPPDAAASWQVQQDTNVSHIFSPAVPAGYLWRLRTISLSTGYGSNASYMVEHLVNVPNGYHYNAIARDTAQGTPALAVPGADLAADIWLPGERIGWRTNGPGPIFGMWSGWQLPEGCLMRLLHLEAPTTGTTAATVDLTPLLTAAQTAASALMALAQVKVQ